MKRFLFRLYSAWYRILPARLTLGVRAIVVDDGGRVCLVSHTYKDGWHLPGGGVKTGEAIVDAVARELYEETGIELPETPKRVLGVFSSFRDHKSDHVVVFVIDDWVKVESRSHEIDEVAFFATDDLPPGTTAATSRRVKEWVTGVPPGHRW